MTEMSSGPAARETSALRDRLAIDRTVLANERTLLAYLRGAMGLVIVGVTFLHFGEAGVLRHLGVAFIPSGIAAAAFGVARYRKMDRTIRAIRARLDATD